MKPIAILALLLIYISASAARAEDSLTVPVRVTKLEGDFNTYSIPGDGTTWTFDLRALTKSHEHGKINFQYPANDKRESWYYPYRGPFLIKHVEKKGGKPMSLRLVNDDNRHRTTISLRRYGDGEGRNVRWRGFFVFEEIEGTIIGVFMFEEQHRTKN